MQLSESSDGRWNRGERYRSQKISVQRLVLALARVRVQPHHRKAHDRNLYRGSRSAREVDQGHCDQPRIVCRDGREGGIGYSAVDRKPRVDAIADSLRGRAIYLTSLSAN